MTKKKRVFVAVTNDVSTDQRVHKVCTYLITKGFEVLVYGRVLPNTISVERNYKIHRTKHWFNENFLFYAEYNIRLFFYLLFRKHDYILSNDLDTLTACFFASKLKRNTTLVYDSHELFSEGPELQGRNFVKSFWKKLEDIFLPRIKKSYTVSQSIVDFYNDRYKNNMGLIRNLPLHKRNIISEEVSFPTKNKVVLYQGVLNPGRGLKPMIKALHFLEEVDLVIIGYGKVEEDLKTFVIKEKMQSRVHFLGRVPHEVLPNYTTKADIGIVLEEPLGKSFEFSLPNKLFDYIHAELPIVSGNLVEINTIVKEFGVGITVGNYDPKEIAEAIKHLLNDEHLRSEIRKNQRKAKQILCWEKEEQKLNQYFKN
ncbi:glycosyltransferase involved in cell wall biosynthesis [Tenacibaculum skagerrakense]|uniref:Glycosyltransferase involved in cell wall biosynthesis n=1 Tax=Tenacibaculum skagerrakense TaxID=186571 RepID=A0A4V2SMU3_9FLAO|nr:glycosyltransferase family 4 protein [Tenacibaculum skagerrakense]TCP28586.1 glycosyltransferase involved in cell wall biosynthesis [Tenacibaculum skagerrakense]